MTDDDIRADALLRPIYISPRRARDTAEVLAGHAASAAELRDWLEALGLLQHLTLARAEQRHGAALILAANARDAAELRDWLDMTGLAA